MSAQSDVVIVSCFGRGHWLAAELCSSGLSVTLVDVSESLGRWAPEDWEGPFGVFNSVSLGVSERTRLDAETPMLMNDRGLCIWSKAGPVEMRGPLAAHQLQASGLTDAQISFLEKNKLSDKEAASIKQNLSNSQFSKSWLFYLCHNFASNQFTENTQSILNSYLPPVMGEHYLRRPSRRAYEENLRWLKDMGVQVLKQAEVTDVNSNSRFMQNIEVKSDWTGVLSADQFVWCLTGQETQRISKDIFNELFDYELVPQWSWQRFRVQLTLNEETLIPEHFIFIDQVGLTWTHENYMIFQQTESKNVYDVWMRIPYSERFHRSYLEDKIQLGLNALMKRNQGIVAKVTDMPQEFLYDETDLGPARLPIYAREDFVQNKVKTWINFMYDSPERWQALDWTAQFTYQKSLFEVLNKWKADRDQRRLKAEQELHRHEENEPDAKSPGGFQ